MFSDAIKNFPKQLAFEAKIENEDKLQQVSRFIVSGMGGSHLAADLIKVWNPYMPCIVHSNYGLPALSHSELEQSLIVASSYSGNTEEAIDSFQEAIGQNLQIAAIATGGELLKRAQDSKVPFIKLPDTGIQPRSAAGFGIIALLKLMREERSLQELKELSRLLRPDAFQDGGKRIAEAMKGYIPLVYASDRNKAVADNWKIRLNETGKIPAFTNAVPESNHNEIMGFDLLGETRAIGERFSFIFLLDDDDHPRIRLRMKIMEKIFTERGFSIEKVELKGNTKWEKILTSLLLADWVAFYTAEQYGIGTDVEESIEEFKKLVKEEGDKE